MYVSFVNGVGHPQVFYRIQVYEFQELQWNNRELHLSERITASEKIIIV